MSSEKLQPAHTLTSKQAVELIWGDHPIMFGFNDGLFNQRLKEKYKDPDQRGRELFKILRVLPRENHQWDRFEKITPNKDSMSLYLSGVVSIISVAGTDETVAKVFAGMLTEQHQQDPKNSFLATTDSNILVKGLTKAWWSRNYNAAAFPHLVGSFAPHLAVEDVVELVQQRWKDIGSMLLHPQFREEQIIRFTEDVAHLIGNDLVPAVTQRHIQLAIEPYQTTMLDTHQKRRKELAERERSARVIASRKEKEEKAKEAQYLHDLALLGLETTDLPASIRRVDVTLSRAHIAYETIDELLGHVRSYFVDRFTSYEASKLLIFLTS